MQNDNPIVTIITACRNSQNTIAKSIESVINQSYNKIQYIIIDGASTDETLKIIKNYRHHIAIFVSEQDKGVYDAWNKGLSYATGEIIGFLNADDAYDADAITQVVKSLANESKPSLVYGNVMRNKPGTNIYQPDKVRKFDPNMNTARLLQGFGFWHTSVFANKQCYEVAGRYFDSSYYVAGDFEWLLRAHLKGCNFIRSYHTVKMNAGGLSDKYWLKGMIETFRAMSENSVKISLANKVYTFFACGLGKSKFARRIFNETIGITSLLINNLIFFLPFFGYRTMMLRFFGASVAENVTLHRCKIIGSPKKLVIGYGSTINKGAYIDARGRLAIGSNVTIAQNVTILTAGHDLRCPAFSYIKKPVEIADFAVLFTSSLISPGVKIGIGAVVLPGSVVSKAIEPYHIVGGNPAIYVGQRIDNLNYSASYPVIFG